MESTNLIHQTIPNSKGFAFIVTAFGKQFGLCNASKSCDEKFIKLFCKKAQERLLEELKECTKTN